MVGGINIYTAINNEFALSFSKGGNSSLDFSYLIKILTVSSDLKLNIDPLMYLVQKWTCEWKYYYLSISSKYINNNLN